MQPCSSGACDLVPFCVSQCSNNAREKLTRFNMDFGKRAIPRVDWACRTWFFVSQEFSRVLLDLYVFVKACRFEMFVLWWIKKGRNAITFIFATINMKVLFVLCVFHWVYNKRNKSVESDIYIFQMCFIWLGVKIIFILNIIWTKRMRESMRKTFKRHSIYFINNL